MSNQDTDATPKVDQWNNGTDVADELKRIMAVRRAALNRFDETVIKKDAPMATMEEALVPLYLYHRYAVESAASAIGGQDYIYAFRGDDRIADQVGVGRAAARRARPRWSTTLKPVGAGAAEERARQDPAASVGLGRAPRAVHALHRRGVRSDQPGGRRGRRHDRLHPDARSRRADGRAARARPDAARARATSSSRCARRRSNAAVANPYEHGNPPRHRARVRRAADGAGRQRADAAGARASRRAALRRSAERRLLAVNRAGRHARPRTLLAADIKRFLERPARADHAADAARRRLRARRSAIPGWISSPARMVCVARSSIDDWRLQIAD